MRTIAKLPLAALVLSLVSIWAPTALGQHSQLAPVPTQKELEPVYNEANSFYATELKQARNESDRKTLAEKLKAEATNIEGDDADPYQIVVVAVSRKKTACPAERVTPENVISSVDAPIVVVVAQYRRTGFALSKAQ